MIVLSLVLLLLLCESLYCFLMKKKSQKRMKSQEIANGSLSENEPLGNVAKTIRLKNLIINYTYNLLDSFCFLLFKAVGYIPSHLVRKLIYKYVFWMDIGRKVVIYYGLEARYPWNITIGKGSIIGDKIILDARYGIKIGENVNMSTGVWMWTLQHDVNSPSFTSQGTGGKIMIENRAWISSRSTILPGCSIAEGVVVAAGAVVTKSITEPFTMWGGLPAKRISTRNRHMVYEFNGKHRLFV